MTCSPMPLSSARLADVVQPAPSPVTLLWRMFRRPWRDVRTARSVALASLRSSSGLRSPRRWLLRRRCLGASEAAFFRLLRGHEDFLRAFPPAAFFS